ncbi:MAG: hypothetical protein CFE23_12855 [Flavobacterium sp. BFFFF1]|uniref:OB-fold protein n=1 Tax=unclassified Flavobacterium TaxID=196869 RepID=UPI000BDACDB3|nr:MULTISPECIES: hypothetical protein [unclassified Flavobacterium]OYU79683.1 MAG: hypothetical protein CFE23_12855 [Flavobacterium sp. BFFFF1]
MNKKLKIWTSVIVLLALVLTLGYLYVMKGGQRNLQTEDAAFKVTAENLTSEFNVDAAKATKKYLNKAIEINGTVTSCKNKELVLNSNVICTMQTLAALTNGHIVAVKGRLIGFDDLMGEIKLDQCYIIK